MAAPEDDALMFLRGMSPLPGAVPTEAPALWSPPVAAHPPLTSLSAAPAPPVATSLDDVFDPTFWMRLEAASSALAAPARGGVDVLAAAWAEARPQQRAPKPPIFPPGVLVASLVPPGAEWPLEWRCLNASHAPTCSRCLPAPEPSDADAWALVGDKNVRNGEKKLRALLTRTIEWADEESRRVAAAAAAAIGVPALSAALLERDVSAIRKSHFFYLCRFWRYRCDAWTPRAGGAGGAPAGGGGAALSRKRRAPSPPPALAAAAAAAAARSARPQLAPNAGVEALRAALRRQLAVYVAATCDARAHAAHAAEPAARLVTWSVPTFDTLLPTTRELRAIAAADAAALAAVVASLGPEEDAGAPAAPWWRSEAAELLSRADAHLLLVQNLVAAWGAGQARLRQPAVWHSLCATDRAIADIWADGLNALTGFVSMGQSALATARLTQRPGKYVRVAAEVVSTLEAIVRHFVAVNEARRAWCVQRDATSAAVLPQANPFWPATLDAANRLGVPSAQCVQPRLGSILAACLSAVMQPTPMAAAA